MADEISKTKEPLYIIKDSDVGFVCIHEFTGGPYRTNKIAQICAKRGYTSRTICLSGHNSKPQDMPKFCCRDWLRELEEATKDVKKHCKKVILVGLSFGGNLVLKVCEKSNMADGIITIETPIKIRRHRTIQFFMPFVFPFKKFVKKRYQDKKMAEEAAKTVGVYQILPLKNVTNILDFMDKQMKTLNKVKVPVLIIQSSNGKVIRKYSANFIYRQISSEKKEILWFDTYKHTTFNAEEIDDIMDKATKFFEI